MREAFGMLDEMIQSPLRLVIGGGASMLLVYGHKEATADIDAVPQPYQSIEKLESALFEISEKLKIPKDWLNTHFTDFTYVVPEDYETRIRQVFRGKKLTVDSFGPEDICIMKLTAGRPKDRPHLRRLFKIKGINFEVIEGHLEKLKDSGLGTAESALELFYEMREEIDS